MHPRTHPPDAIAPAREQADTQQQVDTGGIVARERELETISAFLDLDEPGGRALLLEGEAGIGKTALWRAGAEAAAERGARTGPRRCRR